VLPTASVRIQQSPDRLGQVGHRGRLFAVVRIPLLEQFDDLAAMRIIGFDPVDALDGIATTEREERIAAPFRHTSKLPRGRPR
jgi:hypothetical protein